jgi:glucose-6-phosphate dehydrogenase assembly protein OpcA
MATVFVPELILKDLANLWVQLAGSEDDQSANGVVRACAMTFIVAMNDEERDTQDVGELVAALMHENPSRAILLRVPESEEALDNIHARVCTQCWLPFGQRQQICCEQVEITSPRSLLSDIPKLMLALTAPDLPVVLYVRSPALITDRRFQDLFSLADKIILDSEKFENSVTGYSVVETLHRHRANVGDLAWTRLTGVRQLITQLCEREIEGVNLRNIAKIAISHAAPLSPIAARYLGRWFSSALPEAEVTVVPGSQIEIILAGPNVAISVESKNGILAILRVNDFARVAPLPNRSEEELLSEELSLLGPDPAFRRCFA